MRHVVLVFGLIAGAILSLLMLLTLPFLDRIGFDNGMVIGYTTMVLAFLMVYFGVRSYRDNVAGGRISFGKGLAVGLLISLVATACYVATWEVIYYRIAPDFGEKYSAHVIEKARQEGQSDQQIAQLEQETARFAEMYRNPFVNIAFTFLEPLPVALLFSFVSAWLLSRRKPERDVAIA